MTVGIYALSFEGTDKLYIGQSMNIEKRFNDHTSRLKRTTILDCDNTKLYSGFIKYGIPKLNILIEARSADLDNIEVSMIDEFDSINNGFNITAGGSSGGSGTQASMSKYSRDTILEAFKLLCKVKMPYKEIALITGVNLSTLSDIAYLRSHIWLKEEFPVECEKMLSSSTQRWINGSAKVSRSTEYLPLIGPDGTIYMNIYNLSEFAREHNLIRNNLRKVLLGTRNTCSGFKVYNGS